MTGLLDLRDTTDPRSTHLEQHEDEQGEGPHIYVKGTAQTSAKVAFGYFLMVYKCPCRTHAGKVHMRTGHASKTPASFLLLFSLAPWETSTAFFKTG